MRLIRWLKLRRMRQELSKLERINREIRNAPGETSIDLANKIVKIGHRIAILKFNIAALEDRT